MTRAKQNETAKLRQFGECDQAALEAARSLIFNPSMGKSQEEIETAQTLYAIYNSLQYGYKQLLTEFGNEKQYSAVRDQLPNELKNGTEADKQQLKEARRRLLYEPVKIAVAEFMEQTLQNAGSEAEFLRNFSSTSEETMQALIEGLLSQAVERYWLELTLNPQTEKRQPEMSKVKVLEGRGVEITIAEQSRQMRACLLRINEQQQRQRLLHTRKYEQSGHADTVAARGGYVAKPGASNHIVTQGTQGTTQTYAVIQLDFNRGEWECLGRQSNQQDGLRYADTQRRAAAQFVLLRTVRDLRERFPSGDYGELADLTGDWLKTLQIPHIASSSDGPMLVLYADSDKLKESPVRLALEEMLQKYREKHRAAVEAAK
ncbi:MAG: hypothetical protein RBJ76_06080 [Stenomitos frigidus ULC029]